MRMTCEEWFAQLRRELAEITTEVEREGPVAEYECLRGWYADHSSEYGWTSVHDDPPGLPEELEGRVIVVEMGPPDKYGPDLEVRRVVEVLERTPDRVVVRETKASAWCPDWAMAENEEPPGGDDS